MMKKILLAVLLSGIVVSIGFAGGKAEEKGKAEFQMAAIFQTSIEEPWDGAIHVACLKVAKELGIKYEFAEGVAAADYEKVVREYSDRGFNFIIGDAFLAGEEPSRRVAKDYPKIAYAFGSEFKPQAPNYSVFDNWIHEPAYLSGIIAGTMTKSNVLGVVAAIPIPEVNRLVNAFKAGALSVNPKAKVKLAFIGSWFDPAKAKEATVAMIESKADYIFAERFGVFEAAKEAGVYAFGNMSDQNALAPDVVVTSCVWDMYPVIKNSVDMIQKGAWKDQDLKNLSMMASGGAILAPYHGFEDKLPAALKTKVADLTKSIMNGTFTVPVDESKPVSD
ncbi:MAG: BMP family ABC transporter substrate-binding protein [Treponema sp. GWB1_62_6]|nr:MAG: BMP family ABC transporter substrate-binding protein [Treponema sp. GWB1_62_6]OHE66170.1 MAG: BMP family ABC transporter substrate-binding protein [Treponema sp. GWC1_61_84]OHE71762.1 MAG: BMP family ABC transporter substrate-binding protein [Treponema sp. RIFOXYC1_FULL_61_9]